MHLRQVYESQWLRKEAIDQEVVQTRMVPLVQLLEDVTTVADLGCGRGELLELLNQSGYRAIGVDFAGVVLPYRGNTMVADLRRLPFPNGSLDAAILAEVIEHLPPDQLGQVLEEIERCVRRRVVISVPYAEVLETKLSRCSACGSISHSGGHLASYTEEALSALPFRKFQCTQMIRLGRRVQRGRLEMRFRHYLANQWDTQSAIVCPLCGASAPDKAIRVIPRYLIGAVFKLVPHRRSAAWLAARFDRFID